MRFLVTSTPGFGHIHPLVPLARALLESGHEVTWATASDSRERIERLGFRCVEAGMDLETRSAQLQERSPRVLERPPRARRAVLFESLFATFAGPKMLGDLRPLVAAMEPDVIVHEPGELAAPAIAASHGTPHVTVGFGGVIPDGILRGASDAIAELWSQVGLEARPHAGLYDHLYLHPFPPGLGEIPADRNIMPMRPLDPGAPVTDGAPAWLTILGRDRPCIYITFGTEFTAVAPWRDVIDMTDSLDADAILTVGYQIDPASLGATPPNVFVAQYVPQRLVLERATLLVSHAGSGAVLGAAARGIPQLCLPIAADQFENADAVCAAQAGLMVEPDTIDVDTLDHAARRLLHEANFAAAARRLADEIAAMPNPSDHVDLVASLADTNETTI